MEVIQAGYTIRFDPTIEVYHTHRPTVKGFLNQHYMYGRAYVLVRRKWPEMYCIYPRGVSCLRDVLKGGHFFLGAIYQPLSSHEAHPGSLGLAQGAPIALLGRGGLAMGHDQTGDGIMTRVLLVPASYPPVLGGVQTVAHRLALHLVARDCVVDVLTRRNPKSLASVEAIDGIPVTRRRFLPPVIESLRTGRIDLAAMSAAARTE